MVIYETIGANKKLGRLIKAYSDIGVYIKQDGGDGIYAEAVDPESLGRTYTETSVLIDDSTN